MGNGASKGEREGGSGGEWKGRFRGRERPPFSKPTMNDQSRLLITAPPESIHDQYDRRYARASLSPPLSSYASAPALAPAACA